MSNLKWTFDLKQHTPMIHFQPLDKGVCLRATEVKPRFDRFLLANVHFTDQQKVRWFYIADDGGLASKMKLRFCVNGKAERSYTYEKKKGGYLERQIPKGSSTRINSLYFGNQGGREREDFKETIFCREGIKGTILCFDREFLEIIKKYIPDFFLLNNFGTRQNKGFGSFSVADVACKDNILTVVRKYEPNAFCLDYSILGIGQNISADSRLKDISFLYGLMKGGINNTRNDSGQYYKSAIFRYYLEKNITHEKKVIKSVLFDGKDVSTMENPYFVRAVLGLTDGYVYRDNMRKGRVSVSHEDIKRYSSPIYFKVLDRYTFLFLRQTPEALQNAAFIFSLKGRHPIELKIPDFDIDDFMGWFAKDFNNKEKMEDKRTGKLIRGSLRAADNYKFVRIERLKLRRCNG